MFFSCLTSCWYSYYINVPLSVKLNQKIIIKNQLVLVILQFIFELSLSLILFIYFFLNFTIVNYIENLFLNLCEWIIMNKSLKTFE